MKKFIIKLSLLVTAIALVQLDGCTSCLEKERMGLLEIKAFFISVGDNYTEGQFVSWVDDRMSDCCRWLRVKCNTTTGQVMELSLGLLGPYGSDSPSNESPVVNVTLFRPFEQLQSLDLSYNDFQGFHDNQAYDSLGSLKQLKVLDLRGNFFNGSIVPYLTSLTSLTTLNLRGNRLESSESMQALTANLRNLKFLDVSNNGMRGSLKSSGICKLRNLIESDLSGNHLDGHLPQCLGNLTFLQFLDLSDNKLSGYPSSIATSTSLIYLSLIRNNFEGLFLFSSLANHSKLEVFELSSKRNMLFVDTETNFLLLPQLKVLYLRNCNLRNIPSFLLYQRDLEYIDLSHNKLVGNFPTWLLQNNTKLKGMYLMNNSLTGALRLPKFKHDLTYLEISNNNFNGQLPEDVGMILPKLLYMNISMNNFQGKILSSMGKMSNLFILDLSGNGFSGELPKHFLEGCFLLDVVDLSDNSFQGQIFPHYMNQSFLRELHLNNNGFNGKIGDALQSFKLEVLDVSNNMLSGQIPNWIGDFSMLEVLLMSKNKLEGNIPIQLNSLLLLETLDMSENSLSGPISNSFNLSSVRYLYMQKNAFDGSIPHALFTSTRLVFVDLSDNKFSGSISKYWINKHSILHALLLGRNLLQGHIPIHFCQLRKLGFMDLSHNKFNGSIPSCFTDMLFWTVATHDDENYSFNWEDPTLNVNDDLVAAYYNYTIFGRMKSEVSTRYDLVEVEFMTKNRFESYKGNILNYMSGLDLSSNELSGDIPSKFGDLQQIRALNLSNNLLSGSIPESFSNLTMIESLDLSQNKLSGQVPPQLTELYNLEIFNVSYNNLSGPTPNQGQFATFDENNYKGNPYLCGPQVNKSCTNAPPLPSSPFIEEEGKSAVDMVVFYWSFAASYVIILMGLLSVLWINLYWRMLWFRFIDVFICSCFQ